MVRVTCTVMVENESQKVEIFSEADGKHVAGARW